MNIHLDKRILNILVIIFLSFITFTWTFWIFHKPFELDVVLWVILVRILASIFIFNDYSLSWSKATQKTFLLKSCVYIIAFFIYMPFLYGQVRIAGLLSELAFYLFAINFIMYSYSVFMNRSKIKKCKNLVIFGAGRAGLKLEEEYRNSEYKVRYFVDDDIALQKRSIDGIKIISKDDIKYKIGEENKFDLLIVAMPSAHQDRISQIYDKLNGYFEEILVLPSLDNIFNKDFLSKELKKISVEDLLARHPQDLDKKIISQFLKNKKVLITGAGGSIGSEISRQCLKYGVKELILLDHSEFNLYSITEELNSTIVKSVMHSVLNFKTLERTISTCKPDIILHAAAYKHVPLVESNIEEGIQNNVIGTKNCIDLAIKYDVKKFILISTDKAVRPTNVMGATKRICELYAGNVDSKNTEIAAVRFGNVLGSSGSVIPKFKAQIEKGGPITVTDPKITRYFMLIPEACELVLQTGAIAKGKEIFILDMGEPIKIVDLAKKMIELSGKKDIQIEFSGLRPGEKLYEELLINDSDQKTQYESITVASSTHYDINKLNKDIDELLICKDKLSQLKKIVPEFEHNAS